MTDPVTTKGSPFERPVVSNRLVEIGHMREKKLQWNRFRVHTRQRKNSQEKGHLIRLFQAKHRISSLHINSSAAE
jgi:hypothetical protein